MHAWWGSGPSHCFSWLCSECALWFGERCSSVPVCNTIQRRQCSRPTGALVQMSFLRNVDKPLGLGLRQTSRGVFVLSVESDGVVSAWNDEHPATKVSFGDKLVAVNGIQVDPSWTTWCSILLELRKHIVTMVVTRAQAEDLVHLFVPHPIGEAQDRLLPVNFLGSMAKRTAVECNVVECCICLEELDPDSAVVQLPCKHAFHQRCAETWLTRCPTFRFAKCPMCRQQLPDVLGANGVAATVAAPRA